MEVSSTDQGSRVSRTPPGVRTRTCPRAAARSASATPPQGVSSITSTRAGAAAFAKAVSMRRASPCSIRLFSRRIRSRSLEGVAVATPVASSKPTLPPGPQRRPWPHRIWATWSSAARAGVSSRRIRSTRKLGSVRSSGDSRSAVSARANFAANRSCLARPRTPTGITPPQI